METIEEWRVIADVPLYMISNMGRVKTIKTGRIRKPSLDAHGYYRVILNMDGNGYTRKIHRLVAQHFIENTENKPDVDHINRVKTDNRLCNLRWSTESENQMNKSKQSNNTSGITGISFHKLKNKWQAFIMINRKKKHLGYFQNKEEAIQKRKAAEIEFYGEFAPNY